MALSLAYHADGALSSQRAGIAKKISAHSLRHAFITAALDAGVPLRGVRTISR